MKKTFAVIFALAFLVASCGGSSKKASRSKYRKGGSSQKYYPSSDGSIEDIIYSNLEHRRGSGVRYSEYIKQNGKFDIPYTRNRYVEKWINYFTGRGRRHFARYLTRLGRFMPYIHSVTDRYGLPRDLVYLSMIESGFNIRAKSWASAVGPWQFIRSTGAMYGLNVDYYVDERRDVQKSTHAAAQHLRDLYDEFGHWYLAFAAYNAGAGKVRRAIDKHGRDYWNMVRGRYLRQETKDYVPKIIAAAIIAKDPKKYGFTRIHYQQPIAFETVRLKGATDLHVASECAGVDPDLIRLLNPELLRDMTPPHIPNYQLKIPRGTKGRFEKRYASLRPSQRVRTQYHTVGKHDSVKRIAKSYGVSSKNLAEANPGKIKKHKKRYTKKVKVSYRRRGKKRYRWKRRRVTVVNYSVSPGTRLSIPKSRSLASYSSSRDDEAAYRAQGKYGVDIARVDNKDDKKRRKAKKNKIKKEKLIASKKVTPKKVAVKSDLEPLPTATKSNLRDLDFVAPNQKGAKGVPLAFEGEAVSPNNSGSPTNEELIEVVRKMAVKSDTPDLTGDPEVVKKKWVPEEELKKASPPPAPRYHVVKKGETLGGIARKYRVKISDLKTWNGKKVSPVLLRGAKIKVKETGGSRKVAAPSRPAASRGKSRYYTVRSGDTLSGIARKNRVSVAKLKSWNGKKVSPVLRAGAKILVKKNAVVKYKVKKGDNLTTIAKRHRTTPDKIKKLNGLKSHLIKPGAILVVRTQ